MNNNTAKNAEALADAFAARLDEALAAAKAYGSEKGGQPYRWHMVLIMRYIAKLEAALSAQAAELSEAASAVVRLRGD